MQISDVPVWRKCDFSREHAIVLQSPPAAFCGDSLKISVHDPPVLSFCIHPLHQNSDFGAKQKHPNHSFACSIQPACKGSTTPCSCLWLRLRERARARVVKIKPPTKLRMRPFASQIQALMGESATSKQSLAWPRVDFPSLDTPRVDACQTGLVCQMALRTRQWGQHGTYMHSDCSKCNANF